MEDVEGTRDVNAHDALFVSGATTATAGAEDGASPASAASPDATAASVAVESASEGISLEIEDDDLLHGSSRHSGVSPVGGIQPSGSSAVYRWYEIEATLGLKRREESSIAKCKLCREQGKLERKSCVRFSKSVTSNLWRHLKENHPDVYARHAGEKKTIQMHKLVSAKKRGRKKKASAAGTGSNAGSSSADPGMDENDRFLDVVGPGEEDGADHSDGPKRPAKKARRRGSDQFFQEYGLPLSVPEKRAINVDKVREAAAYMCVQELVPFDLCSSVAFRNLLNECHAATSLLEDTNAMASGFGKQAITVQARKLVEDVKTRATSQMKMMEGMHLMITELTDDTEEKLLGVFGIGLDNEFNLVRRCIHILSVGSEKYSKFQLDAELAREPAFKDALKNIVPHRFLPSVVVMEPRKRDKYSVFGLSSKLEVLESITSMLRDIMISTITESPTMHPFVIGNRGTTYKLELGSFDQVFDSGCCIDRTASGSDQLRELSELKAEYPTKILSELPNVLTGHTIRDILLKVLHLVAHIKQSKQTCDVMRHIMVGEFRMDMDSYAQVFEKGPDSIVISIESVYDVLSVTTKMMPALQRYFELHKDNSSDFSKLIQLASLSSYEWDRVGYLASLLKPFADAVTKLQEEEYVSSSLIIPSVYTLLEKLRDVRTSGANSELPEDMVALKNLAYAKMSSSFGYLFIRPDEDWSVFQRTTFNWLWSATLLDPRTRPFIIKGPLSQTEYWDLVKGQVGTIAGLNRPKDGENPASDLADHALSLDDDQDTPNGSSNGANTLAKTGDLWDDLQANLTSCAQEEMLLSSSKATLEMTKSNNLVEVEISFFQEEARISLRGNPLEWWQNMRIKYPFLARLARFALAIPGDTHLDELKSVHLDSSVIKRIKASMPGCNVHDVIAASINSRLDKTGHLEASNRHLWTTV
ncbi:hypothetical protein Poli38472_011229 [Pythium oligandrum]|uniref:BED-type domain-containing protein n=1 Tax=Pythium oligandrum TaxID=41045 RepID=A0A8K1CQX2_PYTOL|nr:hypothetical protein Poli38472_011229 [Pythium oligandrum]|eukprot:TMW67609.1 hypothetical protein Poli38472_011229 [Pythium oligandrum]